MTNGEKIKVILKPRADQIRIYGNWVEIEIQSLAINFSCSLEWWNAEYKEPTTKTCKTCRNFGSHHGICEICKDNKCWTGKEPTTNNDDVVALNFSDDIDTPNKYQTSDGKWHEGRVTTTNNLAVEKIVDVLGSYTDLDIPYKHKIAEDILNNLPSVTPQELIHGKCNQCKYYEGVHNAQGHAPCMYHQIGGVMWNWYCSQFKSEVKE